nr:hypothetical protein A6C57_22355 [Fibrella sp. ES10-3-2-2]
MAARRLAASLRHADELDTLRNLLLISREHDRTRTIHQAVLRQAPNLGKNSRRIDQDLPFEGLLS